MLWLLSRVSGLESVCDCRKPGVGQARLAGPWVSLKGNGKFALEPSC
jgi:hypothetical protein